MAINYKVLGQVVPTLNTDTTLYTVPAATSSVCSTLTVCNQGVSATVRIAIRPAGASLAALHYVVFDTALNANDTAFFTLGITLAATDVVTVRASTSNVSFGLYGSEIV
jgi:hypothetical protein